MTTVPVVQKIAADGFVDAIDALSIIETLEAGNTLAAVAAVNAAHTDAVAQCIYRALWSRLILVVTRAYAAARPGDQHAQCAFDLLKNPAIRQDVEKAGDAAALAEAIALWAKCRGDHMLNSIRAFRDKQIAHWGQMRVQAPIINYLFTFSRATADALERLAQWSGVVTLSLDSQLLGYSQKADRFWQ
jgi:hypothetical protein